ncbi:hypothetical protein CTI12_AA509200 [Artemisia annua]|uniref:Uncharacterized protein n=1 Tax=Artemisia annua TaxID=35608 RepID=A0A2U1LBN0_ARTAN|nr:hypothetical protein CTI12_AA509200 [Artemisia annua]
MSSQTSKPKRQQQSTTRLQRRAPASIQVSPATTWNVAIPLLSPLISSPEPHIVNTEKVAAPTENKTAPAPVYKMWQHPAAPFYYEPAPVLLHSICSGDRS